MTKNELRKQLRAQRQALTSEQVAASSRQVCAQILASEAYGKAKSILGYLAFGNELNVDAVLAQALAAGKRVYVPYIISPTEFVAAELRDMQSFAYDRFGIRTVKPPLHILEPSRLDLVLVPAVAFAQDGHRLGMGAGYYDRFLPQCHQAVKLGVGYAALLQASLPCDAYDVAVDVLATEQGILTIP